MRLFRIVLLTFLISFNLINARKEDFGYVDVREGAHMFWWLISANDDVKNPPLIIWLQGGPGGSSTGFGNFLEVGPYNISMGERKESWTKLADLLFIDNPVGTGYSYVDSNDKLTKNNTQIGLDLVELMKGFILKHPEYSTRPLYIFCESYGGKMTVAMALAIQNAVQQKELSVNLVAVALGDSWISPIDYCNTWCPYLKSFSIINDYQLNQCTNIVNKIEVAINQGKGEEATSLWNDLELFIDMIADSVDFYNVLNHDSNGNNKIKTPNLRNNKKLMNLIKHHLLTYQNDELSNWMNSQTMRQKLNISDKIEWGSQSNTVFSYLSGDFMNPVIDDVDKLLNSGLKVAVYNGQLDLICDTLGTLQWMDKLQWNDYQKFKDMSMTPFYGKNIKETGGFYQKYKNLEYYSIMKAGHMAPADNPEASIEVVRRIIEDEP